VFEWAWGSWAGIAFAVVAGLVWPLVVLAPRPLARRAVRRAARLWLRVIAMPLRVRGLEVLTTAPGPRVLVANHASELDVVVLTAVLPPCFSFVAKSELAEPAWLRWPLRRLGVLFVRREDVRRRRVVIEQATQRLRAGDSVLFFPEGTFADTPGLLPFRRGAFIAAIDAGVPVVPIAVAGTRAAFRRGQRPRRLGVTIELGAPMAAGADSNRMALATQLRDLARAFIASRCGESVGDATGAT